MTGAGETIQTGAVVLTTGTFLRGTIHIGETRYPAGRAGEGPAVGMAETLDRIGFRLGRLFLLLDFWTANVAARSTTDIVATTFWLTFS